MAIAATNLTNDSSTADGTSITMASATGVVGCGYLFSVAVFNSVSTQPTITGFSSSIPLSGFGLIGQIDFDTVAVSQGTLFVYGGYCDSANSGTTTVTFGQTNSAFAWSIDEFSGVAATPFPQFVTREDNVTPETTGTLGTMVNSNSRSFVAYAKNTNVASVYTLEASWALLAEANASTPSLHLMTAWSSTAGADTATSVTQTTGSQTAGNVLVEIAAVAVTNVSVTAPAGQFSFAGAAPGVAATGEPNISAPAGAFSFAGAAPVVTSTGAITVTAPAGQFAFAGPAPTVEAVLDLTVAAVPGNFSFAAAAPTITGTISSTGTAGPSLAQGGGTWGYLNAATEKSLKAR